MAVSTDELIVYFRIALSIVILGIAARSDWKSRTAEDWLWVMLGGAGIACLGLQMYLGGWEPISYAGLALIGLAYLDIFWDRKPLYDSEKKKVGVPGLAVLIIGVLLLVALFLF